MTYTPEGFDAHVKKEIATYTEFVKVAGMGELSGGHGGSRTRTHRTRNPSSAVPGTG